LEENLDDIISKDLNTDNNKKDENNKDESFEDFIQNNISDIMPLFNEGFKEQNNSNQFIGRKRK
jgi:hypothetical protein